MWRPNHDICLAIEESLYAELVALAEEFPELRQCVVVVTLVPATPNIKPRLVVEVHYGDDPPLRSCRQEIECYGLADWLHSDLLAFDARRMIVDVIAGAKTETPTATRLENHLRVNRYGRTRCDSIITSAASCRLFPDQAAEFGCTIDPPAK